LKDGAKQTIFSMFDAFLFLQGEKCNANEKKKCAVYGEDTVSERVCQNWFAKFHAGDTTCEDRERSDGLWWLMITKPKI